MKLRTEIRIDRSRLFAHVSIFEGARCVMRTTMDGDVTARSPAVRNLHREYRHEKRCKPDE